MSFCRRCGGPVRLLIPPGDDRPCYVCEACSAVHYQNPKVVVGCIPEWEDKVLLCRRAIDPLYGLWTLPAGFMQRGETTLAGAARESREEANARLAIAPLYSLCNLPHIDQVYLLFRGRLLGLNFHPRFESLEARLFSEPAIPWDTLAFAVVKETLTLYFRDRAAGREGLRIGDIRLEGGAPRRYRVNILDDLALRRTSQDGI